MRKKYAFGKLDEALRMKEDDEAWVPRNELDEAPRMKHEPTKKHETLPTIRY